MGTALILCEPTGDSIRKRNRFLTCWLNRRKRRRDSVDAYVEDVLICVLEWVLAVLGAALKARRRS